MGDIERMIGHFILRLVVYWDILKSFSSLPVDTRKYPFLALSPLVHIFFQLPPLSLWDFEVF